MLASRATASPSTMQQKAFATLERTLIVRSDAVEVLDYFCAAYRRTIVPLPDSLDSTCDSGSILSHNGADWLHFNGEPVEFPDERPTTHFRFAFYGSSKLMRLSFRQNNAWRSLYAAALRIGNRAVLISAQSGIGKTTLALELLTRGARFYSDEFAFIRREDRFVSGLPRALLIRERTLSVCHHPRLRQVCEASVPRSQHGDRVWDNIDAGDVFGEDVFAEPAPLTAAFMLERSGSNTTTEQVSPAVAAVDFTKRLNAHTEGFERFVDTAEMLAGIPCYRIAASTPQHAADAIEALLP